MSYSFAIATSYIEKDITVSIFKIAAIADTLSIRRDRSYILFIFMFVIIIYVGLDGDDGEVRR